MSSAAMNTTSQYTPAIKFMSTDPNFTTENPKLLAAIVGKATETYSADTDSGMELRFFVSPLNAGTTNVPVLAMRILSTGDTLFQGNIRPQTASSHNLGTTVAEWGNLYIGTGRVYVGATQAGSIRHDGTYTVITG